jgi:site-specific DNA-methyltransferase (adenine-specific)
VPPTSRLLLGDCLDLMRDLPDGSVDAIVTDPPYGQSNESYDRGVQAEVWRECHRVAAPNAALISFAGSPTYHRIASGIEAGGWRVRQMWGWIYRDGLITSAWPKEGFDRLRPAFDPICYASKGKVLLNLTREGEPWDKLTGRDPSKPSYNRFNISTRSGGKRNRHAGGHYPTALVAESEVAGFDYFALARTNGGVTLKTLHPNTKPLALMRWLVAKLPPGGVVLDPFAGSGTTGVAALAEGRSFLGIERDPAYFAIAEARLAAAVAPAEARA